MGAAHVNRAHWPVCLEEMMLTLAGFSRAAMAAVTCCRFAWVPFQIYHVDTIAFPFVEMLLHLEIKVGVTKVGQCC